jgi:acyl-CoA reductase-like NAD-dependent aldehyde dehydrogenase
MQMTESLIILPDHIKAASVAADRTADAMQDLMRQAAQELAVNREALICTAVTRAIGAWWKAEEIVDRMRHITYANKEYEDYLLDGKLILRLWPIEQKEEDGKISFRIPHLFGKKDSADACTSVLGVEN